jgi:hypothetical protein
MIVWIKNFSANNRICTSLCTGCPNIYIFCNRFTATKHVQHFQYTMQGKVINLSYSPLIVLGGVLAPRVRSYKRFIHSSRCLSMC